MKNSQKKKIALDSFYYSETDCFTVGVIFSSWKDKNPIRIIDSHVKTFEHYIPGEFYKRELPGILETLKKIDLNEFDTIIVDGYCWLNDRNNHRKQGLGMKLYERIFKEHPDISVVGVAKTLFGKNIDEAYREVFRGHSHTPLYITTNGIISPEKAGKAVLRMYGKFRIPSLLKTLDNETKKYIKEPVAFKPRKEICKKRPGRIK